MERTDTKHRTMIVLHVPIGNESCTELQEVQQHPFFIVKWIRVNTMQITSSRFNNSQGTSENFINYQNACLG
jgi:hypothetical protein